MPPVASEFGKKATVLFSRSVDLEKEMMAVEPFTEHKVGVGCEEHPVGLVS
jgi:hypothetical protein